METCLYHQLIDVNIKWLNSAECINGLKISPEILAVLSPKTQICRALLNIEYSIYRI